jgi:hypothetical protein
MRIERASKVMEVDLDKAKYLQSVLALVFMAEKFFFDNERGEIFLVLREVLRMALLVPDHTVVMATYEMLGMFSMLTLSLDGAIRAFQKLRDVAEDCRDKKREMKAYLNIGKSLQLK